MAYGLLQCSSCLACKRKVGRGLLYYQRLSHRPRALSKGHRRASPFTRGAEGAPPRIKVFRVELCDGEIWNGTYGGGTNCYRCALV